MSWLLIFILILVGLLLLIVELLIIPGTTIVGIVGFIVMTVGVWGSFVHFGTESGLLVLFATIVLSGLAVYLSLRSTTWKKAMLQTSIKSKVNTKALQLEVGDRGKTISRLNPMGKANFNHEFYEVSSFGDFIDENTEVRVVEVDGSKILVEKV